MNDSRTDDQRFEIGEIAIFVGTNGDRLESPGCAQTPLGAEVQIVGGYELRKVRTVKGPVMAERYLCLWQGTHYCAKPSWLRKRRPPQDWVRLCSLDSLPREVTHA